MRSVPEPAVGATPSSEHLVLGPALHHGRNVIMSMRGYAELLARRDAPADQQEEWAGRIVHHLDRLGEMFARLEWFRADQPDAPESVSLALVVSTACREVTVRLRRRGIEATVELELHADPLVQGRAAQLQVAVEAFVENAVEADPRRRARVTLDRDDGGSWKLVVEDRGPGLDPELRRRYGDPFFTRKDDRMGLGVYAGRLLLERNDLSFTVTCGREGGTRVHIQKRHRPSGGDR